MSETGLQEFLLKLNNNYQILREREAKYANAAPLDLLNQIDDYEYAIRLTEEAIHQDLPFEELEVGFLGLNLQLSTVVFVAQEPPRKPFTGRNPYRGLRHFTKSDADLFFGRTAAIQSLLETIEHLVETETSRDMPDLVAVLGPSGSGKSSLVQAGLIPALEKGGLPGSEHWIIKVMVPSGHPLDELAAQFVELTGRGLPELRADLDAGQYTFHQLVLESLVDRPPETLFVLVVDQFEELFTLCNSAAERQAFLDQLLYASQARRNRSFIILTMRADFYDKVAAHKRLAEAIIHHQMLVSPLTERELREAILLPAEAVGLELEKALVETLLDDTADAPGVLPLLQQALTELFYYRDGNLLTLEAYQRIGGVKGALAHRADAVLDSMPMAKRHIVRRIFMRLVQLGDGTADTRRRATFSEVLPKDSDPAEVEAVIQILVDASLIVTGRSQETTEMVLDVSHEALITEWPRFQSWLDWDRRGFRIRQHLGQAAREWDERGRNEDSLYRGSRLLEAEEWIAANPAEINPTEAAFIEASVAVRDRERVRTQIIMIGLIIGFVVAMIGAIFGFVGQRTAEVRQQQAQDAQATAEAESQISLAQSLAARALPILDSTNNTELATLLTVEAVYLNRQARGNAQALIEGSLRQILERPYFKSVLRDHAGSAFTVSFSLDGQILASGGDDGTILWWNLADPSSPTILSGHESGVRFVTFSPDEQILASASDDGSIRLWKIADLAAGSTVLTSQENGVLALSFSPDGKILASGSADGLVRLWDMVDLMSEPVVLGSEGPAIWTVAVDPTGQTLAAAGADGVIRLWDMANLTAEPLILNGDEVGVFSLAFSPDGQTLASAGFDQTIRLWDMSDLMAEPALLRGHEKAIRSLSFSPDGQTLASTGFDQTIRLWDMSNLAAKPVLLSGYENAVWAVTFDPVGETIASADADGDILLWNLTPSPANPITLTGHQDWVETVAFSPDGQWLASASDDRTIGLWQVADPLAEPIFLRGHEERVRSVAFSPDGQTLASASEDRTIRLWDMTNLSAAPVVLRGHQSRVLSVAFSPDGRILASGDLEGVIRLWDVTDFPAILGILAGHEEGVTALAFQPDIASETEGQILASASFDKTIRLWNLDNPEFAPTMLRGHEEGVLTIAFRPDGQILASAGDDRTIRLWQMADLASPPTVLGDHPDSIRSVAFQPDISSEAGEQILASAGFDRAIRLWNVDNPEAAPTMLRGHEEGVLTVAFSPDGQTLASGGLDRTIKLWVARLDRLTELACQQVRRNLSIQEWWQFLGRQYLYRRTCPNRPISSSVIQGARSLLREGQVEQAMIQFQHLLELDPTLDIDPEAEIQKAAQSLVDEGIRLARMGEVQPAVNRFEQAVALDPTLDLDPSAEANRLAERTAENIVQAGIDLAQEGDMEGALARFQEAETLYPDFRIGAEDWHRLCVIGSEQRQPLAALEACDRAIELEPENGLFRYSRGLARALSGDEAGAASDSQFFREWLEKENPEP